MRKYISYKEHEIREPGWYYFYPTHDKPGNRERFVLVDEDSILNGWICCKIYMGDYVGPVNMKEFKKS